MTLQELLERVGIPISGDQYFPEQDAYAITISGASMVADIGNWEREPDRTPDRATPAGNPNLPPNTAEQFDRMLREVWAQENAGRTPRAPNTRTAAQARREHENRIAEARMEEVQNPDEIRFRIADEPYITWDEPTDPPDDFDRDAANQTAYRDWFTRMERQTALRYTNPHNFTTITGADT